MLKLSKLGLGLLVVLAVAQVSVAKTSAGSPNSKGPANTACESRNNNSTGKLVECIRQDYLWRHMVDFQQIADANPGPDGHPSRSPGEPGYLASVNYVKALMQAAGYRVSVQEYTVPLFQLHRLAVIRRSVADTQFLRVWRGLESGHLFRQRQRNRRSPAGRRYHHSRHARSQFDQWLLAADFAGFVAGNIALIQRGWCAYATKVAYAQTRARSASSSSTKAIPGRTEALSGNLGTNNPPSIPVALSSYSVGANLYAQYNLHRILCAHIDVQAIFDPYRTTTT